MFARCVSSCSNSFKSSHRWPIASRRLFLFRILFLRRYAVRITSTKYMVQSKRGKMGKKSASKETLVPTSIESREFELSILLDPQCLSSHATYLQSMLPARRYLKTFAISAANFSEFLSTLCNSTEGFRYRFATSTEAGAGHAKTTFLNSNK